MSKLTSLIRRAPKRFTAVVAMIAAAIIIPAAVFAYGPERPTYTYEQPADHVVFNSITNNPVVGDERNFVRVKEVGTSAALGKNVSLQAGKTYHVSVYYHNNAKTSLNESGVGIAKDVALRMQIPGKVEANSTANIDGVISWSNPGAIKSVWDNSTATNSTADTLYLRYVPGSAKVTSNGPVNGASLPDSLFTTGTPLGYDALNGVIKGCNQYAGYVDFEFTVDKPGFTVEKQVSVDGGKTWSTTATTTPGSTILYRIVYKNTGTTQQDNVTVSDALPAGVSYVAGSTLIANSKTGSAYKATDDGVTAAGLNIGSYAPQGNAYVKFSAKLADSKDLACGPSTLHNVGRVATSSGTKNASADVTVNVTCKPNECKPGIPVGDVRCNPPVNECLPGIPAGDARCTEVPELPKTGPTENIVAFLGLGALIAGIAYYVASRKALNQ